VLKLRPVVTLNVDLPVALRERLSRASRERDVPIAHLVRAALDVYLRTVEPTQEAVRP
jgi:hypothetical protein